MNIHLIAIDCLVVFGFSWLIEGGEIGNECGELDRKRSAVFNKNEKIRRICTPYVDLREIGSVQFKFIFGMSCITVFINFDRFSIVTISLETISYQRTYIYSQETNAHWFTGSQSSHLNAADRWINGTSIANLFFVQSRHTFFQLGYQR